MAKIVTPVNQVRLTNVAIVRMKKGGKRFELACYKNKVMDWRSEIEKDIDEVLQSDRVFANVSKGVLAKGADMERAFGTADEEKVCRIILEKGQLQVSSKEREAEFESKTLDIVSIVCSKCVNAETKRPFTTQMIEAAMKEIGFQVRPNKPPKVQALALVRELRAVLPIERAQMRVRVEAPRKCAKAVHVALKPYLTATEEEEWLAGALELVALIDPGSYREVEEKFQSSTRGQGSFEILDLEVRGGGGDEEL